LEALTTFKNYLKDAVIQTSTKEAIIKAANDIVTPILDNEASTLSKLSQNVKLDVSSFGIGIALAFLGEYLATKKRQSATARVIARILGANVDNINRDFILDKLKDRTYYVDVREKILNVTKTASIDGIKQILGDNYTSGEAWEVYRKVKDLILDSEILTISTEVSNIPNTVKDIVHNEAESVKTILDMRLEEVEKRIEKDFKSSITEFKLLEHKIELVTSVKKYGIGDRGCWKKAYFRDADIKNGYDARRTPLTDDIIDSINNNVGTIVYGKPFHGKSLILKRIMFEEIEENGYAVVFTEAGNAKADVNLFVQLLDRLLYDYPNLLVIADNVHKSGGELIFQTFNRFAERRDHNNIRFLFGARKEDLDIALKTIADWNTLQEIDSAVNKIKKSFNVNFQRDDAILYLKQALFVTDSGQTEFSEDGLKDAAESLFDFSKGDPFMFVFGIRKLLLEGYTETFNFIETDIKKKIESLDKEEEIWKTAILCCVMDMFGLMPIVIRETSSSTMKILSEYNISQDFLDILSSGNKEFLFKEERREYRTRHQIWVLEFLTYVYGKEFDAYINQLFEKRRYELSHRSKIKQLVKNEIKQIISSISNNIEIIDHLTLLSTCSSVYSENEYGRYKSVCDLIIDKYEIPNKLNTEGKSQDYYFALGMLYFYKKDYVNSLQYSTKAIEKGQNNIAVWNYKGISLLELGDYKEAIVCFDRALEIDKTYAYAWNNKGEALHKLGDHKEAIVCFDKAIDVDPDDKTAWYNKGIVLHKLGDNKDAIVCFDKAIDVDPKYVTAWSNKGVALLKLGDNKEAIVCFDKAIDVDPKYAAAWSNKCAALHELGEHQEAIECCKKAIEIDPKYAAAWYNRARANIKRGNISSGLADFEKAIELDKQESIKLAKEDDDFESIREDERFKKLMST
jgi:tetratricopeptide (TPR) repeat protein